MASRNNKKRQASLLKKIFKGKASRDEVKDFLLSFYEPEISLQDNNSGILFSNELKTTVRGSYVEGNRFVTINDILYKGLIDKTESSLGDILDVFGHDTFESIFAW